MEMLLGFTTKHHESWCFFRGTANVQTNKMVGKDHQFFWFHRSDERFSPETIDPFGAWSPETIILATWSESQVMRVFFEADIISLYPNLMEKAYLIKQKQKVAPVRVPMAFYSFISAKCRKHTVLLRVGLQYSFALTFSWSLRVKTII